MATPAWDRPGRASLCPTATAPGWDGTKRSSVAARGKANGRFLYWEDGEQENEKFSYYLLEIVAA
jgi:hypothetical protein